MRFCGFVELEFLRMGFWGYLFNRYIFIRFIRGIVCTLRVDFSFFLGEIREEISLVEMFESEVNSVLFVMGREGLFFGLDRLIFLGC